MQWLLEGPAIEPLLQRVRAEHGPDVRIVRAERVRVGGFIGFFAKEQFEVTIEVDDDQAVAAQGSGGQDRGVGSAHYQRALTGTRSDPSLTINGLDALLAAAEHAEGNDGSTRVSFESVMDTMARGGGAGSIGERGVTVLPETPVMRPTGPGWLRSEYVPRTDAAATPAVVQPPAAATPPVAAPAGATPPVAAPAGATPPVATPPGAVAPAAVAPVAPLTPEPVVITPPGPPATDVRHPTSWDPDWDPDWEPPWEAAPWEPAPFAGWTPAAADGGAVDRSHDSASGRDASGRDASGPDAGEFDAGEPKTGEPEAAAGGDVDPATHQGGETIDLDAAEHAAEGSTAPVPTGGEVPQELPADVMAMLTTGSIAPVPSAAALAVAELAATLRRGDGQTVAELLGVAAPADAPLAEMEPLAAESLRDITRSFAAIPAPGIAPMLALEASPRPDDASAVATRDDTAPAPDVADPSASTVPSLPIATPAATSVVPTQRTAGPDESPAPLSRREARRRQPRVLADEGECLPERLAALGVPQHWLSGLPSDRGEALRHVAEAITATPSQARRKQTVALSPLVVVLADLSSALPVARRLAVGLGLDAGEVVVMHKKMPGMVRDRCLPDRAALLAEVDRARERSRALVVVLPAPVGAKPAAAGAVTDTLALLDADEVWAVVDSTRRVEDTASWLSSLTGTRGVDALALTNTDVTVAPAAALNLRAPVVLLGELPATPTAWVSLLAARLAAQDLA